MSSMRATRGHTWPLPKTSNGRTRTRIVFILLPITYCHIRLGDTLEDPICRFETNEGLREASRTGLPVASAANYGHPIQNLKNQFGDTAPQRGKFFSAHRAP